MKTEEKVFVDASLIVYLNIPLSKEDSEIIDSFYHKLLGKRLYTDILALDEALYVSKKKYRVPYEVTVELIERVLLPYVEILTLGSAEYSLAIKHIEKYGLKPSDAIHLATLDLNGIHIIATEDADFDKTHVERLWPNIKRTEP